MKNFFSYFYDWFLNLHRFHKPGEAHSKADELNVQVLDISELNSYSEEQCVQIDIDATTRGNVYRGIGVFVVGLMFVVLQIAIVMSVYATVPYEALFKSTKFGLMVLAFFIVLLVSQRKYREKWIHRRLLAEQLRYRVLARLLPTHVPLPLQPELANQLEQNMRLILFGQMASIGKREVEGQMAYHLRKNTQYEAIEHFLEKLTYWCFIVSVVGLSGTLIGGFLPISSEYKWTMKFLTHATIALPCMVASFHAAAAFLKLSELSMNHIEMHQKLSDVYAWLNRRSAAEKELANDSGLVEKGRELQQLLLKGDLAWTKVALKHDLRKGLA
jgi:hypothetical protein